jgi:hypothetical protein
MNIGNNYSAQTSFNGLKISKNTKKIMDCRGELSEFEKFLPDLERKAKKADITVYAACRPSHISPQVTYGMSIRPLNRVKDNPVTKFFGLSKNRCGDAYVSVNNSRATENTFRDLYANAFRNRRCK